jgi:hypothetical protein
METTSKWNNMALGALVEKLEGLELEGYEFAIDGDEKTIKVVSQK